MKFSIPQNLDVDEIIRKNGMAFYGNNLKKEKLLFICDALINSRAQHRKQINETGKQFVPLSSEILQEVVSDYRRYLDFLLVNEIIRTDKQFIFGEKCIGYCFNYPYVGQRNREVRIESYILKQAIRRALEKRNKAVKKSMWGYSYLTKPWDSAKLKIDLKGSHLWLDEDEKEKVEKIKLNDKIKDRDKAEAIENAIETTEDFKSQTASLNCKKSRYCFKGEGHRFYNPISNLKKGLRGFLTYDGQYLVDDDIKNSQPFFVTSLFKSSFWESATGEKSQILRLENINKEMYEEIKNKEETKEIITLLKTAETLSDKDSPFKKFIDLVVSGKFYEYIQKHFEPLYPTRFDTRDKVKVGVLIIFYLANKKAVYNGPSQTFQTHFPEVYELFWLIKQIKYNYLPLILQRIESFLVIDVICKAISVKHSKILTITIHDNIITTKGNEVIVKDIMSREIENWVGYKPTIEPTDLAYWVPVVGYEGYYEISNTGIVRSKERKVPYSKGLRLLKSKIINSRINNRGYKEVRLSKNGITSTKFVHILSAVAFVPNPDHKPEVNHMDGNKLNNHYTNFEWTTHSENILHAYRIGLIKKKTKPVIDICSGKNFPSIKKAAEFHRLNYSTCKNYLNGTIANPTCLRYTQSNAA